MTTSQEPGNKKPLAVLELEGRAKGKWAAIFESLAPTLLPAVDNAPFHVPCPVHGGENGYRLFEHFNDTGRGICNTCGPQKSGLHTLQWVKANALDSAHRNPSYTLESAIEEVTNWLNSGRIQPARVRTPAMPVVPKMDPALAYEKIRIVWQQSSPLAGTAGERYLIGRGIWKENIPSTLRFHSGLPYYEARTKSILGVFPCILAPIRDKEGGWISIHRIFLTPEGLKADVPDPKRMMAICGELRGAAIKLHTPKNILGVAEGIETALAAHAITRLPMWASVTAGLMEVLDLPDSVERVVIWGDLDRSQRGEEAAEALANRVEAQGRKVELYLPPGPIPAYSKGVDWLDVLQTQGINGFPAKWRKWRAPSNLANIG